MGRPSVSRVRRFNRSAGIAVVVPNSSASRGDGSAVSTRSTADPNCTPIALIASYNDVVGSNVSVNAGEADLRQICALQTDPLTVGEQHPLQVHDTVTGRNRKGLSHIRRRIDGFPCHRKAAGNPPALGSAFGVGPHRQRLNEFGLRHDGAAAAPFYAALDEQLVQGLANGLARHPEPHRQFPLRGHGIALGEVGEDVVDGRAHQVRL